MIKAVIWDLDGTLLYTLEDLRDALNVILTKYGYEQLSLEQTRHNVGHGSKRLIADSSNHDLECAQTKEMIDEYLAYYTSHMCVKTSIYPGICEILNSLKEKGIKLAVVSNKDNDASNEIVEHYFGKGLFDFVYGKMEGIPTKPAPDGVYMALKQMNVSQEEAIYIGDSEVDYQTASNANVKCISVSYGYRDHDLLEKYNKGNVLRSVEELKEKLNEIIK